MDAHDTIVRYNLVTMSNSSTYKNFSGASYVGIQIRDENYQGDNTNAAIEVYGNIVINRYAGIEFNHSGADEGGFSPFGEVRIYNNTVIDSYLCNYLLGNRWHMVNLGKGYIYNNASILYDRTTSKHATKYGTDYTLSDYWTIDNNAFWTTGGSPTVDSDWQTNYVVADPKILGEAVPVDWDGQSGATYFSDIDFDKHLYLGSDSGLIDTGKDLGIGYDANFLTSGTDFGGLPTAEIFPTLEQSHDGTWDIGAIIFSKSDVFIKPPGPLKVKTK